MKPPVQYLKYIENEFDSPKDPVYDYFRSYDEWVRGKVLPSTLQISDEYKDIIGPVEPNMYLVWTGEYNGDVIDACLYRIVTDCIYEKRFEVIKASPNYSVDSRDPGYYVSGLVRTKDDIEEEKRQEEKRKEFVRSHPSVESQWTAFLDEEKAFKNSVESRGGTLTPVTYISVYKGYKKDKFDINSDSFLGHVMGLKIENPVKCDIILRKTLHREDKLPYIFAYSVEYNIMGFRGTTSPSLIMDVFREVYPKVLSRLFFLKNCYILYYLCCKIQNEPEHCSTIGKEEDMDKVADRVLGNYDERIVRFLDSITDLESRHQRAGFFDRGILTTYLDKHGESESDIKEIERVCKALSPVLNRDSVDRSVRVANWHVCTSLKVLDQVQSIWTGFALDQYGKGELADLKSFEDAITPEGL